MENKKGSKTGAYLQLPRSCGLKRRHNQSSGERREFALFSEMVDNSGFKRHLCCSDEFFFSAVVQGKAEFGLFSLKEEEKGDE
jgi:hypothetical protein